MSAWITWVGLGLLACSAAAGLLFLAIAKLGSVERADRPSDGEGTSTGSVGAGRTTAGEPSADPNLSGAVGDGDGGEHRFAGLPLHILVVDDDPNLRALLRTSFEVAELMVEEADSARSAAQKIASRHPDVVVLDVAMPGVDGITFCRGLKADPITRSIPVVLLTGDAVSESAARDAGAEAFLRKPFSPLALLTIVERLGAGAVEQEAGPHAHGPADRQLLLYAQDFRRLLELERGQRVLLQEAYRETVVALARALEWKDGGTADHSERVRRYATELTTSVDLSLLEEPSLEYGFILHDVGKIAIPDTLLRKPEPLSASERRLIETHPVLGEQMVGQAALLRGHGARVVRSHHERWDGTGYPDNLAGENIPLGARIFSIADALDAITSDRPYRPAAGWDVAVAEIVARAGSQFDPQIVDVFRDREEALRRIYYEFNTN
jgi:response regulator RpfG family c-di-GMP phosphodiesterase